MILRTQFENGYQTNQDLGDNYHLVDKESCPEKFKESAEEYFGKSAPKEKEWFIKETTAFIIWSSGKRIEPLFKKHYHYVLTGTGELFQDLSFK